jgi:hypothetical protein
MGGQGLGDRHDRTIGGRRKASEIKKKHAIGASPRAGTSNPGMQQLVARTLQQVVDKHRCQLEHYDRSALAGIYVYLQKCMTGSTVSAYGDIQCTDPRLHFPTYVLVLAYGSPGWGLNPVPMVGGW